MALTTKLTVRAAANYTKVLDLASGSVPLDYQKVIDLATGTAINQADLIFHDTVTLAASGTADLDLAASLTDAYGTTLTFARLKTLIVVAAAGNTNNVNVTRPASNGVPLFLAAGDGVAVHPGGFLFIAAPDATGYAVTAGTGDLITFTNSAGTTGVTYDVILIGASA